MSLTCKYCGANVPAADVNIAALMAKCGACNSVFNIAPEDGAGSTVPGKRRAAVAMPKGIVVEERGNELIIKRKWMSLVAFFLVFFCLAWDTFMVVWYVIAISQQIWAMAAFGLLHAAVGVSLTYYTIALFVNTTTIRVNRSALQVEHGPMRWPGNQTIKTTMIEQLWTRTQVHRNKNGTSYTYEVHANSTQGKSRKLLSGLSNPEEALYIEQAIEHFLGIVDTPVGGEYQS